MKVKKYIGETIQDTIFKVKADLGPDAIILNTRKFKKGGFLGFFAQKRVEVLAALEEPQKSADNEETLDEINDLKQMVNSLEKKWDKSSFEDDLNAELTSIYHHLQEQGVRDDLIQKIIAELMDSDSNSGADRDQIQSGELNKKNQQTFLRLTRSKLKDILGQEEPIDATYPINRCKVVAFIGPTGVGKTTTIAKLAAKFGVESNIDVGLITSDTYRIAAVQQLETYSDIMNIPLEVVYNQSELADTVREKSSDYDLIFVDTAGSSWNDQMQLGRLKKFVELDLVDETHLLVSLNTKSRDLQNIIKHFSRLNPDKMLLTKLDETTSYGDIINISHDYELPYSYITNGQDVPDDINEADTEKLLDYLLGDLNE